jgi:hypothetical protein
MTQEEIQSTIVRERAVLLSHQEKFKSKYFKELCQTALHYLGDAERFSQSPQPNWGIVRIALDLALGQQKIIEDAITHYGYDLVPSNEDLN